MATYVDSPAWKFGGMRMCHLIADSTKELHEFAKRLGLQREWFQYKPGSVSHYDLCLSKRSMAVKLGAMEVDGSELVSLVRRLKGKV